MKKNILVILGIWVWCWWIYSNQNWVTTPDEARIMWESGSRNLRLLNFGLIASAISLFYLKTKSILASIFLGISPWWFKYGVFERDTAIVIFISMLGYFLIKNKYVIFIWLLIVGLFPIYKNNIWYWKDENLNIKSAQLNTNTRFEQETQIVNGQEILPVKFKKISYNKYFYIFRRSIIKFAETLDFENISNPSQKNVTVGNNPYTMKGIALIPISILVLGVFGMAKSNIVFLTVALVTGFFAKSDTITKHSLLLAPYLALGAANITQGLTKTWRLIILMVIIFTSHDVWFRFLYHQIYWDDNKNRTMEMMADLANQTNGNLVVSEILGPTRYYYYYKYGNDNRINFRRFDLKTEIKHGNTTYIGLPGEFAGSKGWEGKNNFSENEARQDIKIIKSLNLFDTVSFGNGDKIWVGI